MEHINFVENNYLSERETEIFKCYAYFSQTKLLHGYLSYVLKTTLQTAQHLYIIVLIEMSAGFTTES
jgi:hypothetical protein